MKKQQKQMLILVAALLLLAAGFFGIRQYNRIQSEKPQKNSDITIVEASLDDITKFSYDYEGITYSFEKEDGVWYAAGDHSRNLVQTSVSSMLKDVAPMTAVQVMENVTDMSQYGLAKPERTISFETAAESHIFYVGDYNSLSGVYYLSKPSGTTVYVVPALTVNRFNKTLEDLTEAQAGEATETAQTSAEDAS